LGEGQSEAAGQQWQEAAAGEALVGHGFWGGLFMDDAGFQGLPGCFSD
jgi:hypothetical protein